jgi:ABC-type ATPase with predicted acetyltransferase domain
MKRMFGVHKLVLISGVKGEEFEKFMSEEIFPAAAEVPGSVNRASQSAIKSQHLLKTEGDSPEYLWVVKDSGVFDSIAFTRVFERMYEDEREKLESFVTRESSTAFEVLDGFQAAAHDHVGEETGEATHLDDI